MIYFIVIGLIGVFWLINKRSKIEKIDLLPFWFKYIGLFGVFMLLTNLIVEHGLVKFYYVFILLIIMVISKDKNTDKKYEKIKLKSLLASFLIGLSVAVIYSILNIEEFKMIQILVLILSIHLVNYHIILRKNNAKFFK